MTEAKRQAKRRFLIAECCFAALASLAGATALFSAILPEPEPTDQTFYQRAMQYANEECAFLDGDPAAFDTCWRATLADFYALKGET